MNHPAADHSVTTTACEIIAFLHEVGHLKNTRREGWWIAGITHPESVAEHSYRTAIIGYTLAILEGANPEHTATLALFHDLPETRLSDIPSTGKPYLNPTPAQHVIQHQTAGLPTAIRQPIGLAITEFEQRQTLEATCAKDADRLECLLQAREYQAAGNTQLQPWIDTTTTAITTTAAQRLATAATQTTPNQWWHDIVATYGRPATSSVDRR